jgi:hypothetical protein
LNSGYGEAEATSLGRLVSTLKWVSQDFAAEINLCSWG